VVAGSCFILPAVIIVTGLAWAYVRFGTLPEVAALLYGIKPVVIGIVVQALVGLGRAALKTPWLAVLGVLATVAALLGINELLILLIAGVIVLAARGGAGTGALLPFTTFRGKEAGLAGGALTPILAGGAALASPSLWSLFAIFLKIGSVLFGSGYVLLAFLRADLVQRLGWISEGQLLDAVAVGQVTPGPVFTTATFIGYLVAGMSGAAVATAGIFLPAFVFVALSAPWLARLRQSSSLRALLDGVNVASLALMVAVTLQLGRVALVDPVTVVLAIVSTYCLCRYRLNSLWLVLGGALIGLFKVAV
jgi:chromate transporter